MEDDHVADAAIPSLLPQRWPAVRDLLAELDHCLNHLATGPGPNLTDIFPRLHKEFWLAAYAIKNSSSPTEDSGSIASKDVRDWPSFLRQRIPDLRLQTTLFAVFTPTYTTIKDNANHLQRLHKASQDLGCSVYDVCLDFGLDIAESTYALQKISALFYRHPHITRDVLVSGLQDEMLSRPNLSPETPPAPTVAELTKAIKKIAPDVASRATSRAPSAAPSNSRASSVQPGPAPAPPMPAAPVSAARTIRVMPPRESRKRAAENLADAASSSQGPAKKRKIAAAAPDDDDDDEEDGIEKSIEKARGDNDNPGPGPADLSRPDITAESSAVRTPDTVRQARNRPSLGLNVLQRQQRRSETTMDSLGGLDFGLDEEEDDSAYCLGLYRQLLQVNDGNPPYIIDPVLRGSVHTIFAAVKAAVEMVAADTDDEQ
ncbi:hypothetical protein GQ607_016675 [Colletotrichum asianum]|uniref:Uncharacterized protein n=1 Tax=Colletotrichum asianum TaxID=702518 RepID=A0A8H3VTD5_9PEZI|nr:hypothetical protein GQ607_016675 [Colletotrichum asianum]